MINDLNRVTLMGHLGADATQKSPTAPVTFSLATTSRWNDNSGDRQSRTEWHNIVVFNNLGKYAVKLKKGDRVYVEGELRTSKYEKTIGDEILKLTSYEVFAGQIDRVAAKADDSE
jgi:single-strand DNA-binding protein